MWNQTAAAATSENNKEKETVEDCSCAGGSVANTSAASVEQQRKPAATAAAPASAIETNSKKSKSETVTTTTTTETFGGKSNENNSEQQQRNSSSSTNAAINKQKEFAAQSETSDSGFISGPQSAPIFSGEISDDEEETQQQQHSEQNKDQDKQQGKQQAVSTVFDSGVVEEEEDEDTHPSTEAGRTEQQSTVRQMRLKDNVDAGIPQWTVAPSVGLNNLGATPKLENSAVTTAKRQPAGNIMSAWEQFYQQNDDGDTWVTQAFPTFSIHQKIPKKKRRKNKRILTKVFSSIRPEVTLRQK